MQEKRERGRKDTVVWLHSRSLVLYTHLPPPPVKNKKELTVEAETAAEVSALSFDQERGRRDRREEEKHKKGETKNNREGWDIGGENESAPAAILKA